MSEGMSQRSQSVAYAFAGELGFDELVGALRAVAEPTRLRLVALLGREELTVTEICRVIGQSQPRTAATCDCWWTRASSSGHLKAPLSTTAWPKVALRPSSRHRVAALTPPNDVTISADLAALSRVRQARIEAATAYRSAHADELEGLRELYVGEAAVERALLDMLVGEGPIGRLLDIGTGTGRILELLAPHTEHSVGLDVDHEMLQVARAALGEAQLSRAAVRHGDLHRPPFEAGSFDVAVMHHVLHLLDAPGAAIADAARLLRPGGRLLVADFATHDLEHLRSLHGHRCLGIEDKEMLSWAVQAGLEVESERSLPPTSPDEQLTVRLWLLRAQSRSHAGASLEPATAGAAS